MISNNTKKYYHSSVVLLSLIILLLSLSCKHTTEPLPEAVLTITLEDISCTEAWIMLKFTNLPLPTEVTLYKNNVAEKNNILCYGDTLLYIDSLLPKQTYSIHTTVKPFSSRGNEVKSNVLNVTTLDTTSHNFTFTQYTFGGTAGSSTLYDVAIIDENNIWAVGEIYMNDSLGNPDPNAFNCVHWDGSEWELKRIYFPTVCGSVNQTPYPASSIFVFDDG